VGQAPEKVKPKVVTQPQQVRRSRKVPDMIPGELWGDPYERDRQLNKQVKGKIENHDLAYYRSHSHCPLHGS
jgi:hypothetical protein